MFIDGFGFFEYCFYFFVLGMFLIVLSLIKLVNCGDFLSVLGRCFLSFMCGMLVYVFRLNF